MTGKFRAVFPISRGKNSAVSALSFVVAKLVISSQSRGPVRLSSSFMLFAPRDVTYVSAMWSLLFHLLGNYHPVSIPSAASTSLSAPSVSRTFMRSNGFYKRAIIKAEFSFLHSTGPSLGVPDCHITFPGHKRLFFILVSKPENASLKFFPKQKTPVSGFHKNACISKLTRGNLQCHH